jgi:hypothetical protein
MVFESDWIRKPFLKLTCGDDGLFEEPEKWDVCIDRKKNTSFQYH